MKRNQRGEQCEYCACRFRATYNDDFEAKFEEWLKPDADGCSAFSYDPVDGVVKKPEGILNGSEVCKFYKDFDVEKDKFLRMLEIRKKSKKEYEEKHRNEEQDEANR